MGIEPTQDASQRPANGFEDRGRHQSSFIPSLANLYFGCQAARQGVSDDGWRRGFSRPLHRFLKTAEGTCPVCPQRSYIKVAREAKRRGGLDGGSCDQRF